jgi:energy-coupling factor transporter transmembrane protein EcfT
MFDSLQRSFLYGSVGFIAALFFTAIFGPTRVGFSFFAIAIALTVVFGGGLHVFARRYDAKLTKRISSSTSAKWAVSLNDIRLGTVTDAEYAALQQRVFRDGRVASAQALNLVHVLLRLVGRIVSMMPFVTFWATVGMFVFAPDAAFGLLQAAQKSNATALSLGVYASLSIVFSLSASATLLLTVSGKDFGICDYYSEGVHRELRRHFDTPAMGNIRLSRQPEDCGCSAG